LTDITWFVTTSSNSVSSTGKQQLHVGGPFPCDVHKLVER